MKAMIPMKLMMMLKNEVILLSRDDVNGQYDNHQQIDLHNCQNWRSLELDHPLGTYVYTNVSAFQLPVSNSLWQIFLGPAVTPMIKCLKMVEKKYIFNIMILKGITQLVLNITIIIIIIITFLIGILVQSMSKNESRSGRLCSWETPSLCNISWITMP